MEHLRNMMKFLELVGIEHQDTEIELKDCYGDLGANLYKKIDSLYKEITDDLKQIEKEGKI